VAAVTGAPSAADLERFLSRSRWLGRSSLLLQDGLTVYVDPVDVPRGLPKADVVFLTHPCGDHCSEKDVEAVATPATVVAGPRDCVAKFRLNQMPLRPGESRDILGLSVKPVAAYNLRPESPHSRDRGWLGYAIRFPTCSIYLPGASSFVPEMSGLRPDAVFLPLAVHDGIEEHEIIPFLRELRPSVVVPFHYQAECDRPALERLRAACDTLAIAARELPAPLSAA
jgi:L-ascorbate metabolism protein UlaG (beta-lactamase superfamily)